jgi:hypothetical protein
MLFSVLHHHLFLLDRLEALLPDAGRLLAKTAMA